MKFKWNNVPIPEAHLVGLLLGFILQRSIGILLFPNLKFLTILGLFLIVAGVSFAAWAVVVAGEKQMSSPANPIISGPFAISRNLMYLGWFDIYCGLALLINVPWLIVLLPVVLINNHFVDIRKEECLLTKKFSAEYPNYQKIVRRYI
jgi:protein-S-isoprenylcysteine O-methyltransferase Ste14